MRDDVADHHTFDDEGALILHERSPINPKSVYATAKVAADFLTMQLLRRVRPARRRHAHVQQLRAAPESALCHRDDHHAGAQFAPRSSSVRSILLRDFCFCTTASVATPTVAAHGKPGDVYVYGQGENISMADWADLIIGTGIEHGLWLDDRRIVTVEGRKRPGTSDVMALRVGHDSGRLAGSRRSVGGRRAPHDPLAVRREPRPLDRSVSIRCPPARCRLVTATR